MEPELVRMDDLVRSERYFTATLLPALLFHDNLVGLDAFLSLIESNASTEHVINGERQPATQRLRRGTRPEIVTEFHISRDLRHYRISTWAEHEPPATAGERERRDAPDVVILVEGAAVVVEAKFFDRYQLPALNTQLESQRRQIRHILTARPDISSYRHVALLPGHPAGHVDADGVITWAEIHSLCASILGPSHYVTERLQNALLRVSRSRPATGLRPQNWDGKAHWQEILALCNEHGPHIQIGLMGGRTALRNLSPEKRTQRIWKWRDSRTNTGHVVNGNWIPGDIFLAEAAEDEAR